MRVHWCKGLEGNPSDSNQDILADVEESWSWYKLRSKVSQKEDQRVIDDWMKFLLIDLTKEHVILQPSPETKTTNVKLEDNLFKRLAQEA